MTPDRDRADDYRDSDDDQVLFGHVLGFKGLERSTRGRPTGTCGRRRRSLAPARHPVGMATKQGNRTTIDPPERDARRCDPPTIEPPPLGARQLVHRLLDRAGETYAAQAGIRLVDKPAALYQLLVLAQLLSTRISADVAVAAARELRGLGLTTPTKMAEVPWRQVVDALGRAHYKRYDEITATRLAETAQCVGEWYGGDLRRLAAQAQCDPVEASRLLQEFPGIGPVGSRIYLREVQRAWTWVRPFADVRVLTAAHELGLPATVNDLVALNGAQDLSGLGAALVHVSIDRRLRAMVLDV